MIDVRIQAGDFDPGRQVARLGELKRNGVTGFTGRLEAPEEIVAIRIDHHPSLAKAELARIAEEASERWPLDGLILIHRHGRLQPCGRVMFAGTAASDVEAATLACAWLVEQLRTRAPFWRKDMLADGSGRWR